MAASPILQVRIRRRTGLQKPSKRSLNPKLIRIEDDDGEDDDDDYWLPKVPKRISPEEQRRIDATDTVERLFHVSKRRIACMPRWRKLFLVAARRYEIRLHRLQEAMYIACNVDDLVALEELKKVIPDPLWSWWAYELGLYDRAVRRCRAEMLRILPVITGVNYPPQARVAAALAEMTGVPLQGTPAIAWKQHGELIIEGLREAFEGQTKFDIARLKEALAAPVGTSLRNVDPGRDPLLPNIIVGVNYGLSTGTFRGWRPIFFAAASPHAEETAVEAAELLVEAKADLTLKDASGGTVLHVAALLGHLNIVSVLLENGAPLEEPDISGSTALMVAARNRKVRIVKAIINWTVTPEREEMLEEAEKADAKFNILKNLELLRVVGANDRMSVIQLVQVGDGMGTGLANIQFRDAQGRQCAHVAIMCIGEEEEACAMLRLIASLKGEVNGQDFSGLTPLHLAARLGRHEAAKALLALKAHPGLIDKQGRTPLMVAASAGLNDTRDPPRHTGRLVNEGFAWSVANVVLNWDGRGAPPAELPLRPPGPPEPIPEDPKRPKKSHAEQAAEEEAARNELPFGSSELEKVKARADVLCSLGFDDQYIYSVDGKVNQGDRLQLFRQILLPAGDRMHGIEALMMKDEDRGKLRPVDRRCRNLWDKLIAPLLTLSILGRLENRQPDLLKYLLSKRTGTLPTWETIAKVITESDSLESRVEVLRSLGFRGPKPRKSCWSGSVWVRDEYPRNPDSAPWEGFQYVDREDADVLGQGPPGMKHEAFRMNRMWCLERSEQFDEKEQEWESGFNKRADAFIWEESPGFKWSGGAEKPITPSIYDKIQLSNRLFINEALAERVLMADRVKLVGEKLLCPLLIFSAESLKKPSIGAWIIGSDLEELEQAEKLALKRDLLRYVAAQISSSAEALSQTGIGKKAANSKEGPAWQAPFQKVFDETKEKLALALMQKAPEELETLTEKAEELRWEPGPEVRRGRVGLEANEAPEDQAELLPEDEIRWFKRRQSTQAYLQLRLCSAIGCAKDLISMAAAVSREVSSRNFAPGFWIASYGLLLWGRARQLRSGLELALRKRLIRAKWPYEDAEESESETEDDLGTEEEEDSMAEFTEEERPVPQFAIYGPRLTPLAEVLRCTWARGPAGQPSTRVPVNGDEQPVPKGPVNMLRTEIVCKNVESLLAAFDVLTDSHEEEHLTAKEESSLQELSFEEVTSEAEADLEDLSDNEEADDEEAEEVRSAAPESVSMARESSEPTLFDRAELHVQRRAPLGVPAKLRLVKVFNGFHKDNADKILPQTAGILLLMYASSRKSKTSHKGHGEKEKDSVDPLVDSTDLIQQLVEVELLLDSTSEARWLANFTDLDPLWLGKRREKQKQEMMEATLAAFRRKSMQEERRNSLAGTSLSAAAAMSPMSKK